MDFDCKIYKTHPLSHVVTIESVIDNRGNMLYHVVSSTGVHNNRHVYFKHLSSAIDYIESNFK